MEIPVAYMSVTKVGIHIQLALRKAHSTSIFGRVIQFAKKALVCSELQFFCTSLIKHFVPFISFSFNIGRSRSIHRKK